MNTSLSTFVDGARQWAETNLPFADDDFVAEQMYGDGTTALELQRRLWDGGYAGLTWPEAYGGRGLAPAYQEAFNQIVDGRQMPLALNMTLGMIGPTLLDCGDDEQRRRYIPEILSGGAIWCQMMSEPSGGSDLAGLLCRADRDGDEYIVNGAKLWTSSAHIARYGLCLARTDFEARKHAGLSMLIVDTDSPGLQIRQVRTADGEARFCEEIFDDVRVPVVNRVGREGDGWANARVLLTHEREALAGASNYLSGPGYAHLSGQSGQTLLDGLIEGRTGALTESQRRAAAREIIEDIVAEALADRLRRGIESKRLHPSSGSIGRLFNALRRVDASRTMVEIGGLATAVAVGTTAEFAVGNSFLMRQASSLGGGSVEIQRNIISERILEMSREPVPNREGAFSASLRKRDHT